VSASVEWLRVVAVQDDVVGRLSLDGGRRTADGGRHTARSTQHKPETDAGERMVVAGWPASCRELSAITELSELSQT
jgi:hypothetical protein